MTNRRTNSTPETGAPVYTSETDTTTETPEKSSEISTDSTENAEESNIVYREPVTNDDGTPGVKEHGPMPVAEWAEYEKENNL